MPDNTIKPVIMAVDDRPDLLTTIVNMLKDEYMVLAAVSGMAALKIIEKHAPRLFLLDIEMPKMNGYELATLIRKQSRFASTPIIFLTGNNTADSVMAAIKHGGNDYLVKPVEKEALIEKINKYLD